MPYQDPPSFQPSIIREEPFSGERAEHEMLKGAHAELATDHARLKAEHEALKEELEALKGDKPSMPAVIDETAEV